MKNKKRRSDRNHILYMIVNNVTGERYIGLTVMRGQAKLRSLKIRWEGHCYAANVENKPWAISESIRTYGPQAFSKTILDVVRGRYEAHKREVELIDTLQPELNTRKKQLTAA
jgi:hypothetical protein